MAWIALFQLLINYKMPRENNIWKEKEKEIYYLKDNDSLLKRIYLNLESCSSKQLNKGGTIMETNFFKFY